MYLFGAIFSAVLKSSTGRRDQSLMRRISLVTLSEHDHNLRALSWAGRAAATAAGVKKEAASVKKEKELILCLQ
jgi:hypothetical protein